MIRRSTPIARSTTPIARSPLKRGTKRVAQMSDRALAQLPERARVVDAAWDRDRGKCQAKRLVPDVRCGGQLEAHERIPRSAWPGGELVLSNIIMVCHAHHRWIGDHPQAAHDLDLHSYSWERP
jgi:hypothetical protein